MKGDCLDFLPVTDKNSFSFFSANFRLMFSLLVKYMKITKHENNT